MSYFADMLYYVFLCCSEENTARASGESYFHALVCALVCKYLSVCVCSLCDCI